MGAEESRRQFPDHLSGEGKHFADASAALELTVTDDEVAALEAPDKPREPMF